jgi:hypothetical protein
MPYHLLLRENYLWYKFILTLIGQIFVEAWKIKNRAFISFRFVSIILIVPLIVEMMSSIFFFVVKQVYVFADEIKYFVT